MSITQHIPADIKRVSRSIGYALWIGSREQWFGLSDVLRARLDLHQRAALAFQALRSLDHDIAKKVAEAALGGRSGQPITPLFSHMDEAAFWADMAEPEEVEAYALACFQAMPSNRQAAFLNFVQRRLAA